MDISQVVNVIVATSGPTPSQPGFGVPLILGTHTHNTDLIRYYSSLSGMVSDGFATTDQEYLAAQALLAQSPRVPLFAVGRRTHLPTLKVRLVPQAVNNAVFSGTIENQAWTYTSDGSGTVAEATAGIKSAIDALSLAAPAVTTTDNTTSLDITCAAGSFFQFAMRDDATMRTNCSSKAVHTDAGIATDLANILIADQGWYGLYAPICSDAEATAAAAWAESNNKLFLQNLMDTDMVQTGSSDQATTMKAAGYANTGILFHPDSGSMAGAAYLGATLPFNPGGVDFKFRPLKTVKVVNLTQSEITFAAGKNCNTYVSCANIGMTQEGVACGGQFLDITRDVAWFTSRLQTRIFGVLTGQPKTGYTDQGIAQIEGEVRAQIIEGQVAGFLDKNRPYTLTAPSAASQSTGDRSARQYNALTFSVPEAGAIHKFTLNGSVVP